MLTETILIDKIEVLHNGVIQVREATVVARDGVEIAKTYRRWTLTPGQDIQDQDSRVKSVADAVWTPDVVSAYASSVTSPV